MTLAMRAIILWPIVLLDRHLQNTFDILFVWLLRRGVPRWVIRRRISEAIVAIYASQVVKALVDGHPFGAVLLGLFVAALYRGLFGITVLDRWAEERGMLSAEDTPRAANMSKLTACLLFTIYLPDVWLIDGLRRVSFWQGMGLGLGFLARGYFAGTPPTRPKPKEERAPLAMPEAA